MTDDAVGCAVRIGRGREAVSGLKEVQGRNKGKVLDIQSIKLYVVMNCSGGYDSIFDIQLMCKAEQDVRVKQ
jgi:hypothetical protein